jgi:hypothetical protein
MRTVQRLIDPNGAVLESIVRESCSRRGIPPGAHHDARKARKGGDMFSGFSALGARDRVVG